MATLIKPTRLLQAGQTVAVELMPGDVAFGQAGESMKTLLGSCVGVILTDPRRTIGVMCHIVHAGHPKSHDAHNTAFGRAAMHAMFTKLRAVGVNPALCEAFVYGGGNMFPNLVRDKHVGATNVDWVLDFLESHRIGVVDHCLGGNGYRKVSWTVGKLDPLVETVFAEQGISHER